MQRWILSRFAFLASCAFVALVSLFQVARLQAQERPAIALPPGDGMELVVAACSQCHSLRSTVMLRDGRQGWRNVVERMVLHGGQLTPEETDTVVEYLYKNFGPTAPGSAEKAAKPVSLPSGSGKELVEKQCSICHDLAIVVALKRTRDEWESINKNMTTRGLGATDDEVQAMTSYLATHFGKEGK